MLLFMNVKHLFALMMLFFSLSAYAETIVVDAENAAGPWGNAQGHGAGNEIVVAAFKAVGIDVKLNVVPYARCKLEVMTGAVVACFSMSTASELENRVRFAAVPLYTPWAGIYAAKHVERATDTEQLLRGKRVGIVFGYEYPEMISHLKSKAEAVVQLSSEQVLMRNINAGKIDFAIFMLDELKSIQYLQQKSKVKELPSLQLKVPAPGAYIGFSLKHPDGLRLKKLFDTGYQNIVDSGEHDKIIDHWLEATSNLQQPSNLGANMSAIKLMCRSRRHPLC